MELQKQPSVLHCRAQSFSHSRAKLSSEGREKGDGKKSGSGRLSIGWGSSAGDQSTKYDKEEKQKQKKVRLTNRLVIALLISSYRISYAAESTLDVAYLGAGGREGEKRERNETKTKDCHSAPADSKIREVPCREATSKQEKMLGGTIIQYNTIMLMVHACNTNTSTQFNYNTLMLIV